MSVGKHVLGMICAGVLAFGGVYAAYTLATPLEKSEDEWLEQHDPSGENGSDGTADNTSPVAIDLSGRWQAPVPANQDAFVEFSEAGLWIASDGCNQASGTWSMGADGAFDGGEPPAMTMIFCDNVPIPQAIGDAERVEITPGGNLVLTAADGAETELERVSDTALTLTGRWVGPSSASDLATIEFMNDGTVLVSAHCTEFAAEWELTADGRRSLPGSLSITNAQVDQRCGDSEPLASLPLNPGSRYDFTFGADDTFVVMDAAAGENAPAITFYKVAHPLPLQPVA